MPEDKRDFSESMLQVTAAGADARDFGSWIQLHERYMNLVIMQEERLNLEPIQELEIPWGGQYLKWSPLSLAIREHQVSVK